MSLLRLMVALYDNSKTKEIDQLAASYLSIDSFTLMQKAGAAVFDELKKYDRILVITGPGNNGGDGFVVAECARQQGHDVKVMALKKPDELSGDAKLAAHKYAGAFVENIDDHDCDCIVDAIFGTGLNAVINGVYYDVVTAINKQSKPVIAVDIPSGLFGDTGAVAGAAVMADQTVAILALNTGLFTMEGPACCGRVVLADLSVPASTFSGIEPDAYLMLEESLHVIKQNRQVNSHKGSFGHVAVVGGQAGMLGAVLLASRAALKSGAGAVTAVTDQQQAVLIPLHMPEIMSYGFDGLGDDFIPRPVDVLVIGMGMGTSQWSRQLFKKAMALGQPAVLDADGLNLLAQSKLPHTQIKVMTPHPKEAAVLLAQSVDTVQNDRYQAVKALADKYDCVVVLKGSGTLVSDGHHTWVCPFGSANLATAGTGDVLAGMIGGLMAQGFSPGQAAQLGVVWHALAGERSRYGLSMTASDLLNDLHLQIP